MDSHISVRDVLAREFVGASEGDTVPASSRLLLEEQADHLVVLRGTDPVGLVSIHDLLQQYVDDTTTDATTDTTTDVTLSDVMTMEYETIPLDAPLPVAIDRFVESSRPLLVLENDELVGLLTESDILTVPQEGPYDDEARIDDTGSDSNDTTVPADQGICEDCGAFTRTLTVNDGRTLCADCRDV
jgi:CBS domain-containing protein